MDTTKHWRTLMNLPYLSGEEIELGKEYTLEIEKIGEAEVFDKKKNGNEKKIIVFFKATAKGMILTNTKAKAISKVLGSGIPANWVGKKIIIFSKVEKHFGNEFPVINVKLQRS